MRAKCIYSEIGSLSGQRRATLSNTVKLDCFQELVVGQEYDVLAVETWSDGVRIYVEAVEGAGFPSPYPAELFEITQPSFPDRWGTRIECTESDTSIKRVSFLEWVENDRFYEDLINGDPTALEIYGRNRNNT